MTYPITPDEVAAKKIEIIPDFVIRAFNYLIAKHFSHGRARISQDSAIEQIMAETPQDKPIPTRADIIMRHKYLNVEEVYRAAGWKVQYVKPDHTESFDPYFIFEPN